MSPSQRTLLPAPDSSLCPDFPDLTGGILKLLRDLSGAQIPELSEAQFCQLLTDNDLHRIERQTADPLTPYFLNAKRDLSRFRNRPANAIIAAQAAGMAILSPLEISILAGLAVGEGPQVFRTTVHFTARDSQGRCVSFIAPDLVPRALDQICCVWNRDAKSDVDAVESALWILVAVLNAHAFPDGNGRLARGLLNGYLIRAGINKGHPMPWGVLIYAARINFEIAVRRVELMGDWAPILRVTTSLLENYQLIAKRLCETSRDGERSSECG